MTAIPEVQFTKEVLQQAAEQQTGLSDWGERPFEPGLDVLLNAINQEAQLNPLGRFGTWNSMVRILSNWLKLQADDYRSLPTDDRKMIFILGPARSGTTLLQRLFCRDPQAGFLRYTDVQFPAPATALGTSADEEKLQQCRALTATMYQYLPAMRWMHESQPEMPDEEVFLFEHQFICVLFALRMYVPSYKAWYLTTDLHAESYRELQRLITYIGQHRQFSHWVFKAPQHLFTLDTLLATFPNAKLIWLHRDPVKTMPSLSSLGWNISKLNSDAITPVQISQAIIDFMQVGIERAMAVREQIGDDQFRDVYYRDLMADPVAEVRRIYDELDLPFSEQMAVAMQEWLMANPQHKHGRHAYSLEEFGLTEAGLLERFSGYSNHFQIPREG
ncbi:MAG: sulfotransferase [Caldilineaceae bacterium]|nr:sulfotransferase [Caldilineaceae bacterium]